jgi:6-phosphogluconolactonase
MLINRLLYICCCLILFCSNNTQAQNYFLFVGTYTTGSSEGIYVFSFNSKTGSFTPVDTVKQIDNPSYLTLTKNGQFLYAVSETNGSRPGQLYAYAVNKLTGRLSLLNKKESKGDDPCYITASNNRKWVIAANYSGGNLVAYATRPNGALSDTVQTIYDEGSSFNKDRQLSPHVHSTTLNSAGNYLFACDLGTDKIMAYTFNEAATVNPLTAAGPPFTSTVAGSGPRHLSFHPTGRWVYVIEELSGMVSAYRYENGALTAMQRIDAHQKNFKGARGSADIHVSPDGRHLYVSNRGDANNLAIFSIEQSTGKLTGKGFQDAGGRQPRNFTISADGKFILVANQASDQIKLFKRNSRTGLLQPVATTINVGAPVCLQLLPARVQEIQAR